LNNTLPSVMRNTRLLCQASDNQRLALASHVILEANLKVFGVFDWKVFDKRR
jgi:hypothetical protein